MLVINPFLLKRFARFFKRLRKFLIFRYFAVGEYGGQFGRPHYHLLMFIHSQVSIDMYRFYVEKCWDKGFTSHGTITPKSINYVTFYILKQSYDENINLSLRHSKLCRKGRFWEKNFSILILSLILLIIIVIFTPGALIMLYLVFF